MRNRILLYVVLMLTLTAAVVGAPSRLIVTPESIQSIRLTTDDADHIYSVLESDPSQQAWVLRQNFLVGACPTASGTWEMTWERADQIRVYALARNLNAPPPWWSDQVEPTPWQRALTMLNEAELCQ